MLAAGYRVIVRPHPRSAELAPRLIAGLEAAAGNGPRFSIDRDRESWQSLAAADAMISDWSGAAFEYAFGLLRPVIFIDTPRKINHAGYERMEAVPFEVRMRGVVGEVVPSGAWEQLQETPSRVLAEDGGRRRERLRAAREASIFNVGGSAQAAAGYLTELLASQTAPL